jgi:hypothetical protein
MKNLFVPYEQALQLKELGFNEPYCFGYYDGEQDNKLIPALPLTMINTLNGDIDAPLYSQAFRWFREKYGSFLFSDYGKLPHITIIQNLMIEYANMTYEEAELACLKKLIEIAKNK